MRVRELEDVVARELRDRLLGAGDVAPERMVRPHDFLEQVLHIFLRLVLVHAQLLEDHSALSLDVGRRQLGVGDDVDQDVKPERQVLGGHARPVRGELLVGRRVDETADAFDGVRDLFRRRPPLRAFEEEVLDEMRHPGVALVLEP